MVWWFLIISHSTHHHSSSKVPIFTQWSRSREHCRKVQMVRIGLLGSNLTDRCLRRQP